MPDESPRVDLIQRYAERLKRVAEQPPQPPEDGQSADRAPDKPANGAAGQAGPVEPRSVVQPFILPGAAQENPRQAPPPDAPPPAGEAAAAERIAINLAELGRKGFLIPGAGKSALSEEFRNVKRPLIKRARASGKDAIRNGNLVLVTSAKPNEGKTFAAVNLALSIAAERDLQVMLVDADATTQGIAKAFNIPPGKGLVDLLLDEALAIEAVVLGSSIPNLSILRSGQAHPDLPELLSSQRMGELVRRLVGQRPDQIVVVDSPPLLASAEAAVLASHAGQTVMVVEHNRTGWRFVDEALPKIDHCPSVSFLLNRVDSMIWGNNFRAEYPENSHGAGA